MIALRFYSTDTFQRDWRFSWCQFVADVKDIPEGGGAGGGGGGGGPQSQLNKDGLTLSQL